ncbi:adenylate/guanylate cyclase domain-containing protein [Gordonia crocea]|uniref:Adenylate cyclase n=1 Tax=Gordonia crocea TaxID=589162 RepID=A0A7I9UVP6_9ACTN|nr:adenylate/guanylate cyclase domain-containing protein [Gordonia crocea]GED96896.1 adenylate cyclase [Gordonia crocea]
MAGRFAAAGVHRRTLVERLKLLHQQQILGFDQQSWSGLTDDERKRIAGGTIAVSSIALVGGNTGIGLETFLLVQLALRGGRLSEVLNLDTAMMWAMVVAIVGGTLLNLVFGLIIMRGHLNWFLSGAQPEPGRAEAIQGIPRRQVIGTMAAWTIALGIYGVTAIILGRGAIEFVVVTGAFSLAAVASACLTYIFAERAVRPLAVMAMREQNSLRAWSGVRKRMLAVWLVSSAVPMVGLLAINAGRYTGLLPAATGTVDWVAVVVALIGLAAGARVVVLVGAALAEPLDDLAAAMNDVEQGDLSTRVAVYDNSELGVLQNGFNQMVDGLAERERMRDLFARHVGSTVAEHALARGDEMSGATTPSVGVLFVDIAGSTTMSAHLDPEAVAGLLNRFFTIVAEVVDEHDGFINKFEGDAALAVFGAPVALDAAAAAALRASRELADRLREELPIKWGIGVSHGTVFAGDIGAQTRYEYTVIGDPVNESARLSELAKDARVPVVASGDAVDAAGDEADHWAYRGAFHLRGRVEATQLYLPVTVAMEMTDNRATVPTVADVVRGLARLPFQRVARRR